MSGDAARSILEEDAAPGKKQGRSARTRPTARLRVNGTLSPPIDIRNGTRQGCPLSPLLYILAMEHLAVALRKTPDIEGLRIGQHEFKISLYADDLLLYITNPTVAFPVLLREFCRFGEVSNFKVNYPKTEALNVSLPDDLVSQVQASFSFKWKTDALKYLGVLIPADISATYALNYVPLLQRTISDLKQYGRPQLSWFGRTAPVQVLDCFFRRLQSAINSFIWGTKKPRTRFSVLAIFLSRIVDWRFSDAHKQWVLLEKLLSPSSLYWLPWLGGTGRPRVSSFAPLTQIVLRFWDRSYVKLHLTSRLSRLSPLFDNLAFPPAMNRSTYLCWSRLDWVGLGQVKDKLAGLCGVWGLRGSGLTTPLSWLEFLQLRSFLSSVPMGALTPFESMMLPTEGPSHVVSVLYGLVLNSLPPTTLGFMEAWERDLGITFSEADSLKIFTLAHKMTMSNDASPLSLDQKYTFDISTLSSLDEIIGAELRILRKAPENISGILPKSGSLVHLYLYTCATTWQEATLLDSRSGDLMDTFSKWEVFNVLKVIGKNRKGPSDSLCFMLKMVSDLTLSYLPLIHLGFHRLGLSDPEKALLVVSSYSRRRENLFKEIRDKIKSMENPKMIDPTDYSQRSIIKRRRKRQTLPNRTTHNNKGQGKRSKTRCSKKPLHVNFKELGWDDWIIAPLDYEAYHCEGVCDFPLRSHLEPTNHAIIQTLMNSMDPESTPPSCCVPSKLSPISILYIDSGNNVVYKQYEDMVVENCGCR
ncbi:unnamed protein product [Ranitomeya imitator]|uniref:Uncharacterized protein n=1 Tax=Ranitomeya imitator TaxID=111125 RepID=A0ABN9LWM7_9NEOB|nr:unnamed protein product [Ranitomeya imitator]